MHQLPVPLVLLSPLAPRRCQLQHEDDSFGPALGPVNDSVDGQFCAIALHMVRRCVSDSYTHTHRHSQSRTHTNSSSGGGQWQIARMRIKLAT